MLVVVKTHHTEFMMKGEKIPDDAISDMKKRYGSDAVTLVDGDEHFLEPVKDMDWFKETMDSMTPGDYLHTYRKSVFRLTQKELAERLGIAKQAVSNMEHGSRPISKQMAKKLAKVFHTTSAYFI